jgi:hypothetical protein
MRGTLVAPRGRTACGGSWERAFLYFGLLGIVLAAACGSETPGESPPPLSTGTASPPTDAGPPDDVAVVDATPPDAGPESVRWTGTLATTKTVEFGGSPYCKYRVTLRQVEIDVTMKKTGEVVNASVKNVVVEESVPPCTFPPQNPNAHQYSLAKSKPAPTGLQLDFAPFAANRPRATLVMVGPLDGASPSATVSLEWHRTDQPAPLDWRVTAIVPVTRR